MIPKPNCKNADTYNNATTIRKTKKREGTLINHQHRFPTYIMCSIPQLHWAGFVMEAVMGRPTQSSEIVYDGYHGTHET